MDLHLTNLPDQVPCGKDGGELDDAMARIAREIVPDARLVRVWTLTGGVSAQMTAVELGLPDGRTRTLVVRRHGRTDWMPGDGVEDPAIADEFRLLQTLCAAGLPVSTPVCLDTSCSILPVPYVIFEYVVGEPVFDLAMVPGIVIELATMLARIHGVTQESHDLSFLLAQGSGFGPRPAVLDDGLDEGRIRDAMERVWPLATGNASVLLHGDFWPGNVLWQDGRIAAVIDWEDARLGDPVVDLAKSRLEVLWAFGADAMHRFTDTYAALMSHVDLTNLPYWDLAAALHPAGKLQKWGLPPDKEQEMRRRHHDFVVQSLRALSVGY